MNELWLHGERLGVFSSTDELVRLTRVREFTNRSDFIMLGLNGKCLLAFLSPQCRKTRIIGSVKSTEGIELWHMP